MHHSYIDSFSQGDSPIHRLDARAKLLAVIAYTVVLVSFSRYALAVLVPMTIAPLAMLWLGGVPVRFALRRVLVLSPFIAALCLFSPLYDRSAQSGFFGPWQFTVTGGWLSAGSIAAKFTLEVLAITALTCTTPFALLLEAMRKLRMPKFLVMQLGFLYRYIFLLIDEAMRIRRARDFRGARGAPLSRRLAAAGGIIGSLFVRTVERSERVYAAMCIRGYRGEPHALSRLHFRAADAIFLTAVAGYLLLCRWGYAVIAH
ncbi:MAG TPA: cobalt ECF transporter T component CbiQ [Phycisphaerae bacterium]|nr:cobalt ECF transporter T component CbiQ [Phycisphaerae bacterium]